MEQALQVTNLCKRYEGFTLDNVSFTLPQGAILGLVGENGAGKSTTIHAILDLIQKDGGTVRFWGRELKSDKAMKEDIGVVFDEISFHETLTPERVGKLGKAAYRQWDEALYKAYLTRFSLPPKKEIKALSKGMKMKLSIAVALSHRPKLLILDEATSGLDPVMRDDILDVFLEFVQQEDHSILMSSHITSDLEKIADYILYIHKGKVLLNQPKDTLRYRYGILRCGKEQFAALNRDDILAWRQEAYQFSVLVSDKEAARKRYPDVVVDDATIDEIMLLYGKGEKVQ